MNRHAAQLIALGAALGLQACYDQPVPTEARARGKLAASVTPADAAGRHLVVFTAERVPADFGERAARLGGSVETALDNIGVAAVTGLSETGAAELAAGADVRAVEPDPITRPRDDGEATDEPAEHATSEAAVPADATASPTSAQFYARQWNIPAVFADQAWAAGFLGSRDVVVAILDSGIDYLHPDLAGLVDLARSKSFASEEDPVVAAMFPGRLPISDLFWHGTAVSSIIASNAKVVAGINHDVTLIAVKVWNRFNQGSFARLLTGIVYAADQGADVINVSGGYNFDKSEN